MSEDRIVSAVSAALRVVAEQAERESDRQWLQETADAVGGSLDDACCPLCQEVTCDDGCPLSRARAIALQQPCGFLHDQWDGPYKMSRRCVAKAGHTEGRFAYDHGPWEGVKS